MKLQYIYPPSKGGKSTVKIRFTYHYNVIVISTGIKVSKENWSFDKGYIKSNLKEHKELFERKINPLIKAIDEAVSFFEAKEITPTKEVLKKKIIQIKRGEKVIPINTNGTLESFLNLYLDYCKKNRSTGTYKAYKSIVQLILTYQKHTKDTFTFKSINKVWFDGFIEFLLTKKNKGSNGKESNGLTNSSINKRLRFIKTFMNWAKERDYHSEEKYLKFPKLKEVDTKHPTLTIMELERLERVKLDPREDKVRDMMLFLCYTGQRWETASTFKKEDFNNYVWIPRSNKTKEVAIVDMKHGYCSKAYRILQKYQFTLPQMTDVEFNRVIKNICKDLEFNSYFKQEYMKGRELKEVTGEKWEFISSHCGRRTLVTTLGLLGVPEAISKKITGHKSSSMHERYNQSSQKEIRIALKQSEENYNKIAK